MRGHARSVILSSTKRKKGGRLEIPNDTPMPHLTRQSKTNRNEFFNADAPVIVPVQSGEHLFVEISRHHFHENIPNLLWLEVECAQIKTFISNYFPLFSPPLKLNFNT